MDLHPATPLPLVSNSRLIHDSPANSDSTWHAHSTDGRSSDDDSKHSPYLRTLLSNAPPDQRPSENGPTRTARTTPGPLWSATLAEQEHTIIAGGNITNFWSFLASAAHLDGDVYIVQEHGIRQPQLGAAATIAAKNGFELLAGPLDETDHSGVGVLIKKPGRGQEMPYISEEGRQARAQGRLIICRVDTAKGYEAVLVSVYCWSGGTTKDTSVTAPTRFSVPCALS